MLTKTPRGPWFSVLLGNLQIYFHQQLKLLFSKDTVQVGVRPYSS